MITQEQFTEQAASAKVVDTTAGPALLIGGIVIQVVAPGIDAADYLSIAFRRLARGDSLPCCNTTGTQGQPLNEISSFATGSGLRSGDISKQSFSRIGDA